MNNQNPRPISNEVNGVRGLADELLQRLISERRDSEQRLAEKGRSDPLKVVTGRSAIDNAITSTIDLIHDMEQHLDCSSSSLDTVEPAEATSNGWRPPLIETIRPVVQARL